MRMNSRVDARRHIGENYHMKYSLSSVCDAVVRWSLYGALALTPFFFLPTTPYPVDLSKQTLLAALACVAALAWLTKAISLGKFEYARSRAGIPLGALVVLVGISAFFSGAAGVGFMGVTGAEADTALALGTFAVLYFLFAATFREKDDARRAFVACMAGAVPVVVHGALQVIMVRPFPWDFTRLLGFNPIGTVNALGLYLCFAFVLAFGGAHYCAWGRRMRIWLIAMAVLSAVLAFFVGYWASFSALIAAILIQVALDPARHASPKAPSRRGLVPMAVIAACVFMVVTAFGILPVPLPRINVQPEIAPSIAVSWHIVKGTAREGVRSFLLGSGPATYSYQYGKYRDAAFNATSVWNVDFSQGFNAVLTHLVSWGVFLTVLLLLFIAGIVLEAVRFARGKRGYDGVQASFAAAGAYLVVALFLYPQNFTLYFLLCAIAGILTAVSAPRAEVSCKPFVRSLFLVLALLGFAGFLYMDGRRYLGAVRFGRGVALARTPSGIESSLPMLASGVSLDSRNDVYLRVIAEAFLARANAVASAGQAAGGSLSPADRARIAADSASAVAASERAVQINPGNAAGWLALARTYEAVMAVRSDAAQGAFAAYAVAERLRPNDPSVPAGIGMAHMAYADLLPKEKRDPEWQVAVLAFDKAISLKPDYFPAHLALVAAFDRQGKSAEAVVRAERMRALASADPLASFQLGILHYQAGRMAKAQDSFEGAVRQAPEYADALWFLGLVYDQAGNHTDALAAFERVLQLNPGNKGVTQAIANLRSGVPALGSASGARALDGKSAVLPVQPR